MAAFHEEKLEECKKVFVDYLSKVTISPDVLHAAGLKFTKAFQAALTDEGDPKFGPAAWQLTAEPLKASVRKLAALTEYFARESNTTYVTLDHVKAALDEVQCSVVTHTHRKRRLEFCGWM